MLMVSFKLKGIGFVMTQGKKHTSPNAGYPEAALAYILNCRFGGPNYYKGQLVDKPFIGLNERPMVHEDINKGTVVNLACSVLFCVLFIAIVFIFK